MPEIKWIKITTDIFDDEKILLIESMPNADSLIVIWFKLLAFAGKSNNNGVFMLSDKIPYTDEMLATIFRRPINTVRLALSTFESFGMIEYMDGVLTISNWEKHQNVDGMEKIREQNRKRVAAYREKQKLLSGNVTCNVTVTERNAVDKDKDKEQEKDKECIEEGETAPAKRKRFTPPTIEEVKAYCIERKNGIDPQAFIDYYEARGWNIGKNKMKDWKAAVRTWENRQRPTTVRNEPVPSWINTNPEEDTKRLEKLLADLQKGDDP